MSTSPRRHEVTKYDRNIRISKSKVRNKSEKQRPNVQNSVKTTELATSREFDGHKKIKGDKWHIVLDTLGLLLMVLVHDANLPDGKQAVDVLRNLFF